jgi:anti-sigma regulatory factor (Ser/Thr protein kinase)
MQIQANKVIKKYRQLIFLISAIAIIGGFLSFVFLSQTNSTTQALAVGFFYASALVMVLNFVQKSVVSKLPVFNPFQQWIIRTFIYTISVSAAYLAGILFQSIIFKPDISFTEIISERFWSSFVTFISSPLDLKFANDFLKEEFRSLLIPFFAVIILIGLVSIVGSYVQIRWQHNRQQQAVDRAELTALKAQIEPHFIFNSLNTIASQIKTDPEKAEMLLLELSDILRYIFNTSNQDMIEINSEISFLEKYLSLMMARFRGRLNIQWNLSLQNQEIKIPAFILQPAIENALRHGWREDGRPMNISIDLFEGEHEIVVTIRDDGCGIDPHRLRQIPIKDHALANVLDRLKLTYKKNNMLSINSKPGRGTTVQIKIPKVQS